MSRHGGYFHPSSSKTKVDIYVFPLPIIGSIMPLTSLLVMVPSISLIIIFVRWSQTKILHKHLVVPANMSKDHLVTTQNVIL